MTLRLFGMSFLFFVILIVTFENSHCYCQNVRVCAYFFIPIMGYITSKELCCKSFLPFLVSVRHTFKESAESTHNRAYCTYCKYNILSSYYQDKEFQFLFVQKTRKFRSITLFPPPISRFRNAYIFAFRLVGLYSYFDNQRLFSFVEKTRFVEIGISTSKNHRQIYWYYQPAKAESNWNQ